MDSKIYSLLGLCMKAGRLTSGEFMVEKSVKNGTAKLVIIANDASANTKKLFNNICKTNSVRLIEFGSKVSLGNAIGKDFRASIAILDEGFVSAIDKKIIKSD